MSKVASKKSKQTSTEPSFKATHPAGEPESVSAPTSKTSKKGWEMTAAEALRINYVDQEIISQH